MVPVVVLNDLTENLVGDSASDGAAVEGATVEGAAVDGAAVEGAAVEGAAVEGAAVETAAVEDAAVEDAAVETAAVEGAAVEGAAVEDAVVEATVGAVKGVVGGVVDDVIASAEGAAAAAVGSARLPVVVSRLLSPAVSGLLASLTEVVLSNSPTTSVTLRILPVTSGSTFAMGVVSTMMELVLSATPLPVRIFSSKVDVVVLITGASVTFSEARSLSAVELPVRTFTRGSAKLETAFVVF